MQRHNTKRKQKKQPSGLYKRAEKAPKRQYKRKVKQSPTLSPKPSVWGYLGLLIPIFIVAMFVGGAR